MNPAGSRSNAMSPSAAVPVPASILRSIRAVVLGLVAIFAVTTAVDVLLHMIGVFPPMDGPPMSDALCAFAFAYRFPIDVGGCWLTARLAPTQPMKHALIL